MNGAVQLRTRLIASLADHARSVDTTFAAAGRDLTEGLGLFDALKERLTALSGQLTGERIVAASATLGRLSEDLRPLRQMLAEERRALQDIVAHSAAAGQTWEKLVERIRLITILARASRIESVSVEGAMGDFGDFANEIVELTTQAQRTIETSAREHHRLSALLTSALTAQHEFETRYGPALWSLADKLSITLAEVENRQQRGVALATEAAARSGKIAMAAGAAIIALQSGDSIRQRLEHAIAGLRLAETLQGERAPDGLPVEAMSPARDLLHRLQARQLEAGAAALGADVAAIEENLLLLRDDTESLAELVQSLYGADGADTGSFMAQLGTELARASELLGKCNSARAAVDKVAQALAALVDVGQQTIDALATTVSNIALIGTNAGLRAARVGSGGRSLVVIAQELKAAADLVSSDSRHLPSSFAEMQRSSTALQRMDGLDAGHFSALDRQMDGALAIMRETAAELTSELGRLMRESATFGKVVDQARLGFSNAAATGEAITAAARAVAEMASPHSDATVEMEELARAWLTDTVWPYYTMAVERTIHREIIPASQDPAVQTAAATDSDDIDALLF